MIAISIIFISIILIILMEYKELRNKCKKKEFALFSSLLCIGITLNILNALHVKIPPLVGWLKIVYRPISNFFIS